MPIVRYCTERIAKFQENSSMELRRHPESEIMTELKQSSFAPQKLIALRSAGMHTVRFEFIKRLLQINAQITTLSIYWEDGRNFFQIPIVQKAVRKLVFASTPRVSGKFDEMSLLCYACDAEAKAIVDAEVDRMIAVIRDYWLKSS